MSDIAYPTIDADFFSELIRNSPKVAGSFEIGSTEAFYLEGTTPLFKRTIIITRSADNQIGYIAATGIAFRVSIMSELLEWLEINRNWKSGGYFVAEEQEA